MICFQVAHSFVNAQENLRILLITLTSSLQMTDVDISAAQDTLYKEMISKLCNTRIQEFLSAQKQRYAAIKGCASTIYRTNFFLYALNYKHT